MAEQDGTDWREKPDNVMYTDAQWLQRLLDSPREEQLTIVRHVRAAAEIGQHCDQFRHGEVIEILRRFSMEKTRTIRRLEGLLSQEEPRQEPQPAE